MDYLSKEAVRLYDIHDDNDQQCYRKDEKSLRKGALAMQDIHRAIKDRRIVGALATCKIGHSRTDKHNDQTRQLRSNHIAAQFN